jgi:WD40 repeat protein
MNLKVIDNFSLFAGYENGELVLFDTRILKEIDSINCFNGQPVMCFDYSKEIGVGAAGSSEHELKSFKLNLNSSTSKLEEKFATNLVNPGLNCLEIRKTDSKIFACGGWDSRVRVYGIKKLKLLAVLDFHKDPINSIKFSSFNQMAVGSADGMISFWNIY